MAETLTAWIGGGPVQMTGDPALALVSPVDGSLLAHLPEAGEAGVAEAVAQADAAFRQHRKSALHERAGWLTAWADRVRAASEEITAILVEDIGKPVRAARFEALRGADFLDQCAAATLQIAGETIPVDAVPAGAGRFGFSRHVPYGVVAAITPFNAPVNLLLQKVGPAIAAGNAVVAKPAPAGTRAALVLARLFHEAGCPEGLFNVLPGDRETALALVRHRSVAAVSFTGGTLAGDALAAAAGAKKFTAELGSNAVNIVMADADIADAATRIASAAFEASGQQCISAQRLLVEQPVRAAFESALVAAAHALALGDPADTSVVIGPMVHKAAADRVMAMAEDAVARGARVVLPPEQDGCFVTPGILADVPREARLWREEAFGPLAVIVGFESYEEAMALANDSEFGLQGAVFTASLHTALAFSQDLEVGSLWINEASRFRLDMAPFGGVKRSGVGREGVKYAIEEMSQTRFTGIRF